MLDKNPAQNLAKDRSSAYNYGGYQDTILMKKILLGILILFSHNIYGQSNHDFKLGLNYPFAISEGSLARKFGVDCGYQYSKIILKNHSVNAGIYVNAYQQSFKTTISNLNYQETYDNDLLLVDFYFPFLLGYSYKKYDFYFGLSFNVAQFIEFGDSYNFDPETQNIDTNKYLDRYVGKTFKFGFNAILNYKLTERLIGYLDFKTIRLDSNYPDTEKRFYGLVTMGINLRLTNNRNKIE